MSIGARIQERLEHLRMSQSELARRLRLNQSTIAALVAGRSRSSTHLHRIARELLTTPAYLSGETDDPDADAPPPPPPRTEHHVFMRVVLPPEEALEAMFRGLIRSMPDLAGDDLARELAKLLPIGFEQLQGPLRYEERAEVAVPPVNDLDHPDDDHERRRA